MKLRNRGQVIDYIYKNSPHRYIRRAIESGTVEYLGGFSPILPGNDPGWILKCHSPITHKSWNVAIIAKDSVAKYSLRMVPKLQWENWMGDLSGFIFYRGDNPAKYAELKREIRSILDDKED